MIRKAICAGTWYPDNAKGINSFLNLSAKKEKVIAGICPHAGWLYSGKIAGEVFSKIEPASVYVLIGPNHTGVGSAVSVFNKGSWETPIGELEVEETLAEAIIDRSKHAEADYTAHSREHSIEVQLPFIKTISPEAKIVPIALSDYSVNTCRSLGESIAEAILELKLADKTVLIASTDMSHYISAQEAKDLDSLAIEKILSLEPEGLLKIVKENNISMCGSGPTAAVIWAAKKLGGKKASLIKYSNSGYVTGDYTQVVGYAGITIK